MIERRGRGGKGWGGEGEEKGRKGESQPFMKKLDISILCDLCPPQITRHVFGETKVYDLLENGASITVTKDNREKYIYNYMRFFLITSIKEQFQAFRNGFLRVCAGKILVSGVWLHGGLCREDTGEWGVASWGSVPGRYW